MHCRGCVLHFLGSEEEAAGAGQSGVRHWAQVFHAGTANGAEGQLVATGGRVLGITALGGTIAEAQAAAYQVGPPRNPSLSPIYPPPPSSWWVQPHATPYNS